MDNEEFVKKVYLSSVEGPSRRGRPLGRGEDKVKEYMSAGKWVGAGKEECMDTERGVRAIH